MKTETNHPQLTTEQLVRAARQYAYSLSQNESDAQDLVQQSWMKLLSKYGEVANRRILFTSIRNLWYDQLRRQKVVSFSPLEGAPEPHTHQDFGYSVDMESALAQLNPRERQSLYLNVVEGYTAREIGERLDTPRGTILCDLTRARAKLRKLFSEEFERPTQLSQA
ncbi:RNA polymerase sigma factor [Pelagicoccus sp. SDUM812003]|uniref:RNA polymerase sigma factor n=1 Tax=Pelagicoccus sp. SDUM812003 TaxID=3041267 RepID=UPI00280E27E3|nr:RNA polymerase sigma factor [Pelagicoccus sp. SDUM812003]MDQ8205508.1 RNA polymerase sigma factor [Pelagicoccus sp. SDUM812003]